MKILVLGDIHGRPVWRAIIAKENPDKVIFLGDYVTTHELYTAQQQLEELKAILDFKEANPDTTILLRGNHDLDGLGYYWAHCYPSAADVQPEMNKDTELGQRFLKNTQWLHVEMIGDKPTIFAHAGVTRDWLETELNMKTFNSKSINDMEPNEHFGFTGGRWDNCGTDPQQSCTWIRPDTLCHHHIVGWDQVVGHTGTYRGCESRPMYDVREDGTWFENGDILWQCDALQQKAYLVIENNKYIPKTL